MGFRTRYSSPKSGLLSRLITVIFGVLDSGLSRASTSNSGKVSGGGSRKAKMPGAMLSANERANDFSEEVISDGLRMQAMPVNEPMNNITPFHINSNSQVRAY